MGAWPSVPACVMHTEAAIGAPQHVHEKGGNFEPPRCRIRNLGGRFLDRRVKEAPKEAQKLSLDLAFTTPENNSSKFHTWAKLPGNRPGTFARAVESGGRNKIWKSNSTPVGEWAKFGVQLPVPVCQGRGGHSARAGVHTSQVGRARAVTRPGGHNNARK